MVLIDGEGGVMIWPDEVGSADALARTEDVIVSEGEAEEVDARMRIDDILLDVVKGLKIGLHNKGASLRNKNYDETN